MARKRNLARELELERQRRAERSAMASIEAANDPNSIEERKKKVQAQLVVLANSTAGAPVDHDRDILWAYQNMGNPHIMPVSAPSAAAWGWYEYSAKDPLKFLEVCAKREDAKIKQAGSITNQRMEDDRRQQFDILDRIEKQLTMDVSTIIDDLMTRFPEDTLLACSRHEAAWKAFREKYQK